MVSCNFPMNHNRLILTCQHPKACTDGADAKRHNRPVAPLLPQPRARPRSFRYPSSWVQPCKTLVQVPSVWQLLSPACRKGHMAQGGRQPNSCLRPCPLHCRGGMRWRTDKERTLADGALKATVMERKGSTRRGVQILQLPFAHRSGREQALSLSLSCREQSCLGRERKR